MDYCILNLAGWDDEKDLHLLLTGALSVEGVLEGITTKDWDRDKTLPPEVKKRILRDIEGAGIKIIPHREINAPSIIPRDQIKPWSKEKRERLTKLRDEGELKPGDGREKTIK